MSFFGTYFGGNWNVEPSSVEIVKGWTRSTVVATILAAAAEVDLRDPEAVELVKPLAHVLDKCWLLPIHVTCSVTIKRSFLNSSCYRCMFSTLVFPLLATFKALLTL